MMENKIYKENAIKARLFDMLSLNPADIESIGVVATGKSKDYLVGVFAFTKDKKIYLTEVKRINDVLDDEAEITLLECNGVFGGTLKKYGKHPSVILVEGDKRAFCEKHSDLHDDFKNDEYYRFVRFFGYLSSKSKYTRVTCYGNIELTTQWGIDIDDNEPELLESRYRNDVHLLYYVNDNFFLPNTLTQKDIRELLSIPLEEEEKKYKAIRKKPTDWFNLLHLFRHLNL